LNDAELASALLRTAVGASPRSVPTNARWPRWRWYAQRQRVVPLLYHLATVPDATLDPAQTRELRTIQGDAMVWAVRLEHKLLETAEVFDDHAVPYAVLKGLATAHLDYPLPEWRQFGDIDVLVAPDRFADAIRVLEGRGWSQAYALPRGHRRFTHAVTFTKDNIELDLHQHIAHRAIGLLVPTTQLLANRRHYNVAGRPLWALSDADRLVHAALHAYLSRGETKRLSSVADVLAMAARRPELAPVVTERAGLWSVANLVSVSVSAAFAAADLELPPAWREPLAKIAAPRWVERAHLEIPGRPWTVELAYLSRLPTWSDRARYIGGHLSGSDRRRGVRTFGERLAYLWSKVRGER